MVTKNIESSDPLMIPIVLVDHLDPNPKTMSVLRSLPLDVLPSILDHLTAQSDLAAAARVSRVFNTHATPFIYRSVSLLPWNKSTRDQVAHRDINLIADPRLIGITGS